MHIPQKNTFYVYDKDCGSEPKFEKRGFRFTKMAVLVNPKAKNRLFGSLILISNTGFSKYLSKLNNILPVI